ncbi:MAG: ATP-binding protein [Sedimentisphaerales bacterium]|nr:ATP-binding protein [Sedimentisphaerales bacterium]
MNIRKTIPILIILIVVAGAEALLATLMMKEYSHWPLLCGGWILYALIVVLCVIWSFHAFRSHARTVQHIREQLLRFEQDSQIGMIMVETNDDLARLVAEINKYLTNLRFHLERDKLTQKELQIQARAAETETRQIEAVINSISDAVIVTDRYDELVMANKAAQDLYEFDFDLNYRLPVDQIIEDDDLLQLLAQLRWEKSTHLLQEMQYSHPLSGVRLDLKLVASCVFDKNRQVIGGVVVVHDVTAEKEIARMKDDFVNCISHELKTPLANIKAYTEMLSDKEVDNVAVQEQFYNVIQDQAQRLNSLIDDILNSSRMESGQLKTQCTLLNLVEVVQEAVSAIGPQARERQIEFTHEILSEELVISADRDMILQAVLNLLSNAVKYSPQGKSVMIQLRSDDNEAVLEVKDQGIGIPAESLGQIFDKFYRVPENNHFAGGTGLGLYLVRKIIQEVHQGRVQVTSCCGEGTTFKVMLPLAVVASRTSSC